MKNYPVVWNIDKENLKDPLVNQVGFCWNVAPMMEKTWKLAHYGGDSFWAKDDQFLATDLTY